MNDSAPNDPGRPWMFVVWALALFVLAHVVTLVIACSSPPVLVP